MTRPRRWLLVALLALVLARDLNPIQPAVWCPWHRPIGEPCKL